MVAGPQMSQPRLLSPSTRSAIAKDLIGKWQSAASARPEGGGSRWATILTKAIASADSEFVLRATTARSIDELHAALTGAAIGGPLPMAKQSGSLGNGPVAPQILGAHLSDLTYNPLLNGRCRIADSRLISSPLVGSRNLYIEDVANYASQGGNGTYSGGTGSVYCGIPYYVGAYALSVTLLSPAGSGSFKVFKYGAPLQTGNSVWLNAGSSGASADLIVRSCQGCNFEISIYSPASVHYVIDIVGYYAAAQFLSPYCYTTDVTTVNIGAGSYGEADAPACAADYMSFTSCYLSTYQAQLVGHIGDTCMGSSPYSGATTINAWNKCCRIAGKP